MIGVGWLGNGFNFMFSDEVSVALKLGKPIVALESTIISHGLPYPQNLALATELEDIVRKEGAVPATIMLMNGKIHIGISKSELEVLASPSNKVQKVSRRDIAWVLSQKLVGATTVSATSLLAVKAGISIFATGGIGGVHRDGESTMDISADLNELGRTPITVVSAGVKSILDIGRTLEYLETQGVTVVGYQTDDFPAFFTSKSGFSCPCRLDTPEECAGLIYHNQLLQLNSGILIANPIPVESEADSAWIESCTQEAINELKTKNITGRDITPFLLKRVAVLTKGASLASNLALVKNNAKLAAKIAVALHDLKAKENSNIQKQEYETPCSLEA